MIYQEGFFTLVRHGQSTLKDGDVEAYKLYEDTGRKGGKAMFMRSDRLDSCRRLELSLRALKRESKEHPLHKELMVEIKAERTYWETIGDHSLLVRKKSNTVVSLPSQ